MLVEGQLCWEILGRQSSVFFWCLIRLDDIEVELASTNLHLVKLVQLMQWEANLLLQVVTMNQPFFDKDKSVVPNYLTFFAPEHLQPLQALYTCRLSYLATFDLVCLHQGFCHPVP